MGSEFLPIGRVVAAHGMRGELRVQLFHPESELLDALDRVVLGFPDGESREYGIVGVRQGSGCRILQLRDVKDRTAAEQLVKCELQIREEWLPETEEGEYYYRDLVGLKALDREGNEVGVVAEVFDNGAHDVLVIRSGERELLVPFVDEVVVEVDVPGGRLLLDPPPGLLEP